ncbi:hypothetical protein MKW92_033745 [Papaver armeniacum]|nr:hypothetical protein MKW92_033745 [Papaver armeniacum]
MVDLVNPGNEDEDSFQKSTQLRTLQSQLLHNHHNKIYTKQALDLSPKLLGINPEFNTAWNYRKLVVQHNLLSQKNQDFIKSILDQELKIVEIALERNCKSYGAWHHRKWILNKGLSSFDHKFNLLSKFQEVDSRNFHAWNYRRFVVALRNVPEEEELKYTTEMIDRNISNYSAWHNRSHFSDPDDQSGWFYYFWLLDQTITPDAPVLVSTWPVHSSDLILSFDGRLDGCILSPCTTYCSRKGFFPFILYFNENVEGVNSSSVNIKYMFMKNEDICWKPLSTTDARCAKAWVAHLKFPKENDGSLIAYPVEVTVGHSQGIMSYSRSNYNFPSRFAFTVRIDEGDCKEVGNEEFVWLDDRFSDEATLEDLNPMLSFDRILVGQDNSAAVSKWKIETILSEIDLFRKLNDKIGKLALARLLIAHDAMMSILHLHPRRYILKKFRVQLLSCLNLSHNRFRSLTALEPLRLFMSLGVLDISYNEIGLHSIDTTRYLYSSLLSDTVVINCEKADIEGEECSEAVLFFKGLPSATNST